MDREMRHEPRFSIDLGAQLQKTDPRSSDIGQLRYFLDQKLKQNASRNLFLSTTPYRYSFRKPTEQIKTKRAWRPAPKVAAKDQNHLPKLSSNSESLVSVTECSCGARRDYLDDDFENLEPEERRTPIRANRSSRLHPSPPHSRSSLAKDKTSACNLPSIYRGGDTKEQERTYTEGDGTGPGALLRLLEKGRETTGEFSRVMDDGSRVTATHTKLYIEVFLPTM